MAELTVQSITEAGLAASYAAAGAAGDTFENLGGDVALHVKNASGGSINVTVTAQNQPAALHGYGPVTKANAVVAVPAGTERFIGPFPRLAFNNGSGKVEVEYSGTSGVTVAALRILNANG